MKTPLERVENALNKILFLMFMLGLAISAIGNLIFAIKHLSFERFIMAVAIGGICLYICSIVEVKR